MSVGANKIKRTCRLCLMLTERHKRYELYVKSEVDNDDPPDKEKTAADTGASGDSQLDEFSNMLLYEKVEYCCGIRLAPKSELPSKICGKCFYMIHMWLNFRQMSCNSQIILAAQTNIKLEDDAIARNLPEMQQKRRRILGDRNRESNVELITPDAVKQVDCKVSHSIVKLEVEVLERKDKNSFIKSNEGEEEEDSCPPHSEEEISNFSEGHAENESNKSMAEICRTNEEEEQDCLAEICIEQAILEKAFNEEHEVRSMQESQENISPIEGNNRGEGETYEDSSELDENEEIDSGTNKHKNRSALENTYYSDDEENNATESEKVSHTNTSKLEKIDDDNNSNFKPLQVTETSNVSDSNDAIQLDRKSSLTDSDQEDLEQINNKPIKGPSTRRTRKRKTMRRKRSIKSELQNDQLDEDYESNKQPNSRRYMCSICGNTHSDYLLFRSHVRTHSKKTYNCEICQKSFRLPTFLKRHMNVHTADIRYKCKYCELSYSDISSRHRHEKSHTDSPKYKCPLCDKRFMFNSILQRHVQNHSGEKKYSCAVCNTSFALPHHLKSHIKTRVHERKQQLFEAMGYKIVFETKET